MHLWSRFLPKIYVCFFTRFFVCLFFSFVALSQFLFSNLLRRNPTACFCCSLYRHLTKDSFDTQFPLCRISQFCDWWFSRPYSPGQPAKYYRYFCRQVLRYWKLFKIFKIPASPLMNWYSDDVWTRILGSDIFMSSWRESLFWKPMQILEKHNIL